MSTEAASQEEPPVQKSKKHKEKSDRKESKKRKRGDKDTLDDCGNVELQQSQLATTEAHPPIPSQEQKIQQKVHKTKAKDENDSQKPLVKRELKSSGATPDLSQSSTSMEKDKKKKKTGKPEEQGSSQSSNRESTKPSTASQVATPASFTKEKEKNNKSKQKETESSQVNNEPAKPSVANQGSTEASFPKEKDGGKKSRIDKKRSRQQANREPEPSSTPASQEPLGASKSEKEKKKTNKQKKTDGLQTTYEEPINQSTVSKDPTLALVSSDKEDKALSLQQVNKGPDKLKSSAASQESLSTSQIKQKKKEKKNKSKQTEISPQVNEEPGPESSATGQNSVPALLSKDKEKNTKKNNVSKEPKSSQKVIENSQPEPPAMDQDSTLASTSKNVSKDREKKKKKSQFKDTDSSEHLNGESEPKPSKTNPDSALGLPSKNEENKKQKRKAGETDSSQLNGEFDEKGRRKKKKKSKVTNIAEEQTSHAVQSSIDLKASDNFKGSEFSENIGHSKSIRASKSTASEKLAMISDTDSNNSPFFVQTTCFYLPLAPIAQDKPLEGLCAEHFSPLILTFAEPFSGVVLSYSKPRYQEPPAKSIIRQLHKAQEKASRSGKTINKTKYAILANDPTGTPQEKNDSKPLAKAVDEYGVAYVWVAADFLILQPQLNSWIEGYVSVQSPSQLGLVCWNLLNASIERKHLPEAWKWVGDSNAQKANGNKAQNALGKGVERGREKGKSFEGHYLDGNGEKIEGKLHFRVLQVDSLHAFGRDRNFMSIEGSLLTEGEAKRSEKSQ